MAHARRSANDRCLRGLRMVTGSLAGLAILAGGALPATTSLSRHATDAAQADRSAAAAGLLRALPAAPMDQARADEWWPAVLHVQRVWKLAKGAGVTIAVLDTGVDGRHQDLTGRVIQGPDYTSGGRALGSRWWGHHGTSIASIIAAHGHGPGGSAGVLGVAPQAKILSIRVTWENEDPLRQKRGAALQDRDAVAKGIRYAVDHGASVINMSLGATSASFNGTAADEDAIKYALGKGVVLIASMGNDGAPPTKKYFPAAYQGVIAVGGVDRKLKPWKDSNRGDYVSVSAPGVGIIAADVGNAYQLTDGTSASSAIVSGLAALVRSRYPKLTPDQIKQALQQGVTHQPPGGRNDKTGTGIVDAVKVLAAASGIDRGTAGTVNPPAPVVAKKTSPMDKPLNLLLIGILGGGGTLVLIGLLLGWLQRRRPGVEAPEQTSIEDEPPRIPAEARVSVRSAPDPISLSAEPPSWSATEAEPPAESYLEPMPLSAPVMEPVAAPEALAAPAYGLGPPASPPPAPASSTLRPFEPMEYVANGHGGSQSNGGGNGNGHVNGDGGYLNGDGRHLNGDGGYLNGDGGYLNGDGGYLNGDGGYLNGDGGYLNGNGQLNGVGNVDAGGHLNGTAHVPAPIPTTESRIDPAEAGFGDYPLGDIGPLPPADLDTGTPLADETWRRVQDRTDDGSRGLPPSEQPTDTFPVVGPVTDIPDSPVDGSLGDSPLRPRKLPDRPDGPDDEDYRPPWL